VRRLEHETFEITVWLARWRSATGTLSWVNCGHPAAYVVDPEGNLDEIEGPRHAALGKSAKPSYRVTEQTLMPGQRVILVTNGIINRRLENGGTFGVEGIREALQRAESPTAAATATAIQQAVTDCWNEPLEDDGTIVVMAVD
jgi:serine phosphatase RsbU (regulator of sigma subunit)